MTQGFHRAIMANLLCVVVLCAVAGAWQPSSVGRPTVRGASVARRSTLGLYGDWESSEGGSYLLEPAGEAKGVVHFVGGAFIGAASQLTYRYLLERFASDGYLVVATPFRLSFDYLSVCDAVEASFESAVEEALGLGYDAALFEDVVGVGHSCGALLQALIATRRRGERRRLALLSYNNKGATEAIPGFEDIVTPIATELSGGGASGERSPLTPLLRTALGTLRGAAGEALDAIESEDERNPFRRLRSAAPPELRELGDALASEGGKVARQGLEVADQLPSLLEEIANGAREFQPTPMETRELLRDRFRADDVLVVQFDEDDIDESDEIYAVLRDAARNKAEEGDGGVVDLAPQVDGSGAWASSSSTTNVDGPYSSPYSGSAKAGPAKREAPSKTPLKVRLARTKGTHVTPLTQDIFIPANKVADYARAAPVDPLRAARDPLIATPRGSWLRSVDDTYAELLDWLA